MLQCVLNLDRKAQDAPAELMGAGVASAAFVEQRLADHAAERAQLERAGVVAERAPRRHQSGIRALPLSIARAALVPSASLILPGDRAYAADVPVRFRGAHTAAAAPVGFHGASTSKIDPWALKNEEPNWIMDGRI